MQKFYVCAEQQVLLCNPNFQSNLIHHVKVERVRSSCQKFFRMLTRLDDREDLDRIHDVAISTIKSYVVPAPIRNCSDAISAAH